MCVGTSAEQVGCDSCTVLRFEVDGPDERWWHCAECCAALHTLALRNYILDHICQVLHLRMVL